MQKQVPIQKKNSIETERLVLRPLDSADAEVLTDILTDPVITKTFMVPDLATREDYAGIATKIIEFSQLSDTEHLMYGICFNGALIGFVNDCGVDGDTVEVGYAILPAFHGHGFATEALAAVLRELFAMGFKRITAGYFEGNTASRRVMEKCGMRHIDKTEVIPYRGTGRVCLYCEIVSDITP